MSICFTKCLCARAETSSSKVVGNSLTPADRLGSAKNIIINIALLFYCCHCSSALLFYASSLRPQLDTANLFGRLMLWHRPVEDYMRWSTDLWWLVVHCAVCVSACEGECVGKP